jgi:hypothetical protein
MEGTVLVVKDVLCVGPLQKEEGQKFSELRSAFWQEVAPNEKAPIQVDDMERLLEASAHVAVAGALAYRCMHLLLDTKIPGQIPRPLLCGKYSRTPIPR